MALAHAVLSSPPPWRRVLEERRWRVLPPVHPAFLSGRGIRRSLGGTSRETGPGLAPREVSGRARLKAAEAPAVESGQIRKNVEIPVTCYQILGVLEQAEKDEIVKAAMELKNSEIEDGYTLDVTVSRQDLLMDARDKLLFEPEFAGNIKERIPPKCSIRIPWAWLPGALCLLQEVGEEKLVLDIGRTALQHPDAKPYVHDLLLSMALAECSIAKTGFEKNKVSEGFEALARAQYLLKSKISLEKMPLLSQIEESLEELAPSCTLELLGTPHTPDNADRRRGAIAALRELLRQGLDVESSCRVQDWSCFMSQAMNKLMATELVDLLSWDTLAITRKNKKSLESQNQRVVIDFNCFYVAMIAHIALGFSTRQTDLINKAKTICECLIASEGIDLKFEEAFCSFLLGQGSETIAAEKLQQLENNGSSPLRNYKSAIPCKEDKDKGTSKKSLETWMKDAVLGAFPDTRDCSPSLANFFGGPKRILNGAKQKWGTVKPIPSISHRSLACGLQSDQGSSTEPLRMTSVRHLGEAVKQLAPASLQSQPILGKAADGSSPSVPSVQLKRNPRLDHPKVWEGWCLTGDVAGRFVCFMLAGCIFLGTFKLFDMQLWHSKIPYKHSCRWKLNTDTLSSTMDPLLDVKSDSSVCSNKNLWCRLQYLFRDFRWHIKHAADAGKTQNAWPIDNTSSLPVASTTVSHVRHKRHMPTEEAEALVRQWQDAKAEALGPNHQMETLPEILAESMLIKWEDLASSAKARSCFWRFVLLQLSILRADIILDGIGSEMAEIEAVLEEAAELIDESQPKHPNYYSTYKIYYVLKRQNDGSWRFCASSIQNSE